MHFATAAAALGAALFSLSPARERPAPYVERVVVNDNRVAAGVLQGGVLTLHLELRDGEWHPDGESEPGVVVRAFAEQGKPLLVPGPMIRVPEGTEIHAFVRNTLSAGTLIMRGFSPRGRADAANDTVQILPGATRELRFTAGAVGTYYYAATVAGVPDDDKTPSDAELHGAFVIDPRGAPSKPRDRVLVIGLWGRAPGGLVNRQQLLRFSINGKAWPKTERLSYDVGDTIQFRIINASIAVHPMHLHGFYFNVDSRGNGTVDSIYDPVKSPRRVVTERLAPGQTIKMTWVPERAGNWMFHCHDNFHVLRNSPFDGSPRPPEHTLHVANHALEMMGGLVMGIEVRAKPGAEVVAQGTTRRRLRLVARVDSGGTIDQPAYGYVLQDGTKSTPSATPLLPGPTILLKRGEPVSITVVNELPEATAVHWHGMELESYFDGVAGFSGIGRRIAPAIAPRDSFEAQFTPPRSGTFIYHPHADEVRQQKAGLSGALLVVDSPESFNPTNDIVLMLTAPRTEADAATSILINGKMTPAPLELRVGERYRLRFVDIHTFRPSMVVRLLRDSSLVTWRAVAKDGMDLPSDQATTSPSIKQMGNGETYDFELTPTAPGELRLTVSAASGTLLATMPVRIR